MAADLPPPNPNVHPLIRLGRWGFLIWGIFYGSANYARLKHKVAKIHAKEEVQKVDRDAKLAKEKDAAKAAKPKKEC